MGFSHTECMNLPVWKRKWFIERINEEFKKSNNEASRAAHHNTPESRALQGKARPESPARLRRFT